MLGIVGGVTDPDLPARTVDEAVTVRRGAWLGQQRGIIRPAMIEKMSARQWQEVIDVHLTGAFYWLQGE